MDPQKLASLDPKLREAYQRVMGTPIPPPTPTPPAPEPQSIPTPTATPEPQFSIPSQAELPEPSQPQPPVQPTNFDQMDSQVPATPSQNFIRPPAQVQTMSVKKKNSMMPILFAIAGLFFIAIYTLFWLKIFNFKFPFLP